MTHPLLERKTIPYTIIAIGVLLVYKGVKMYGREKYDDGREVEQDRYNQQIEQLAAGGEIAPSCANPQEETC